MNRRGVAGAAGVLAASLSLSACVGEPADPPPPAPAPSAPADLSPGRSEPVADPLYPEHGNPDLDVLHYDLAFVYDPESAYLSGRAVLTIRPVTDVPELRLDFAGAMSVTSTSVDGAPVDASVEADDLVVDVPATADERVTLTVTYAGTPRKVPAPASRSDMAGGLGMQAEPDGSLWTMQEPYGAYTWYPVNDHPSDEALYDISVTVPEGWTGIASGELLGVADDGGYTVTRWRSAAPVASYVTTLAVDEFTRIDGESAGGVPVVSWVPRERANEWRPYLEAMPAMLDWLAERYGPYPFPQAGVVLVGGTSGMETQGTVTISAGLAGAGRERAERVLLHELAHQWFGNAVTPRDWRGLWLSEGVATYVETMWAADQGWVDAAEEFGRWREADPSLRADYGPPGDPSAADFASANMYYCPALMLVELRERLGDETFTRMLRAWVQEQLGTSQDRASFTAWVGRYADEDLTGLIDAWLDSPTTPPE